MKSSIHVQRTKKKNVVVGMAIALFILIAQNSSLAQFVQHSFWKMGAMVVESSGPSTYLASTCSGAVTIQHQNAAGIVFSVLSSAGVTINLSATQGGVADSNVTFYSDIYCLVPITSISIAQNQNSGSFYFIDRAEETNVNIVLSPTQWWVASPTPYVINSSVNGFYWTGEAGDSSWKNPLNWAGHSAIPGSTNVAIFDPNKCTGSNCNCNIDQAASVAGVRIYPNFPGSINQGAGFAVSVPGAPGWIQMGGLYNGDTVSSAAISLSNSAGIFHLSAGTFNSTNGTMTVTAGSFYANSSFGPNSGTVKFNTNLSTLSVVTGTNAFNSLTLATTGTSTITLSSNISVNGNLSLGDSFNGGTITGGTLSVKGNILVTNYGYDGTTLIKLVGTTDQSISASGATIGNLPKLTIASTGGTITAAGNIIIKGTNYTYTSGTVNWGTSTLTFNATSSTTIIPGAINYGNVTFDGSGTTFTLSPTNSTMAVTGTFTVSGSSSTGKINSGTVNVSGDVVANVSSAKGFNGTSTGIINLIGPGPQYVYGSLSTTGPSIPNLKISSGAGSVVFSGNVFAGGTSFNYVSGSMNWGTANLYFSPSSGNTFTITPGSSSYGAVTFYGNGGDFTLTADMYVSGNLNFNDQNGGANINGNNIFASGNIYANGGGAGYDGSTITNVIGSTQTITGSSGINIPNLTINSLGTVTYSGTIACGGTSYSYNSGSLSLGISTLQFSPNSSAMSITPGATTYYKVTFRGNSTDFSLGGNNLDVSNTLTFNDQNGGGTINSGNINATGNITAGGGGGGGYAGSALVKVVGSASQTITGSNSYSIPNLLINSTGGTVTLSGTVQVAGTYTYTAASSFSSGASTLKLVGTTGASVAITPGTVSYNSVTFAGSGSTFTLGSGTFTIASTLTLSDTGTGNINSGDLAVSGNVTTTTNGGYGGTANLKFVGSAANQTLTLSVATSKVPGSVITVAMGAGRSLLLGANATFSSQTLTVTSGSVNISGKNLTLSNLILNSNSLTRAAGVLNVPCDASSLAGAYCGGTVL